MKLRCVDAYDKLVTYDAPPELNLDPAAGTASDFTAFLNSGGLDVASSANGQAVTPTPSPLPPRSAVMPTLGRKQRGGDQF